MKQFQKTLKRIGMEEYHFTQLINYSKEMLIVEDLLELLRETFKGKSISILFIHEMTKEIDTRASLKLQNLLDNFGKKYDNWNLYFDEWLSKSKIQIGSSLKRHDNERRIELEKRSKDQFYQKTKISI